MSEVSNSHGGVCGDGMGWWLVSMLDNARRGSSHGR